MNLIGNGKSNYLFDGNSQLTIAFNVPQHMYNYHFLAVIDERPILYMQQHNKWPSATIYCTDNVQRKLDKVEHNCESVCAWTKTTNWNSGHHAFTEWSTCYDTHLWGFDSLWSDDVTSQCDAVIPRQNRPKLNQRWYPVWQELFNTTETNVYIHMPQGAKLGLEHEKITAIYH